MRNYQNPAAAERARKKARFKPEASGFYFRTPEKMQYEPVQQAKGRRRMVKGPVSPETGLNDHSC
jgi:hypothetical protein